MPRSNTITKHKSCLFCPLEPLRTNIQSILLVLQSTRRPDSAATHLLLSWPVRWKKPRETQREKSKISMGNIAIIAHFPIVGFKKTSGGHWEIKLLGFKLVGNAFIWLQKPPKVSHHGRNAEGGVAMHCEESRRTFSSPSPAGLNNKTRCRTTPLRMLALEVQFTVGGSLSGQSHLQKLQRCVLKWVLAPSLQPSTSSTNRDNYNKNPSYGRLLTIWQTKIFSALSKVWTFFVAGRPTQEVTLLRWDWFVWRILHLENFLKLKIFNLNKFSIYRKVMGQRVPVYLHPTFPNVIILLNHITICKFNIGPTNRKSTLSFYYLHHRPYLNFTSFFH